MGAPHLHGSPADVQLLADRFVLFPIFLLAKLGAVQDGSACTAAEERFILRLCGLAGVALGVGAHTGRHGQQNVTTMIE